MKGTEISDIDMTARAHEKKESYDFSYERLRLMLLDLKITSAARASPDQTELF